MDYKVQNLWNGTPSPSAHVNCKIRARGDDSLEVEIDAPFYGTCPVPAGEPGKPFLTLWDYEGTDLQLFS